MRRRAPNTTRAEEGAFWAFEIRDLQNAVVFVGRKQIVFFFFFAQDSSSNLNTLNVEKKNRSYVQNVPRKFTRDEKNQISFSCATLTEPRGRGP